MPRLKGKTALVTGGANGIGSVTCDLFCREGAQVGVLDRAAELASQLAAELNAKYGDGCALALSADITSEADSGRAIAEFIARFGALTTLINNAGIREYGSIASASRDSWTRIVEVNLLGTANITRAALPEIRRGGRGSIVNVSSTYALVGRKEMGQYDATKAALLSLTRTLACEEAMHGIRVNAVCPGGTLTDYQLKRLVAEGRTAEDVRAERRDTSLLRRWAETLEVAYPILWLASDEASFITGAAVMVDGGTSAM